MSILLDKAIELPIPERIKLVEDIWDSIEAETKVVQVTPEQRAELDRRLEDYRMNPEGNIPWETIKAEALARR